jgi:hypothetical protein
MPETSKPLPRANAGATGFAGSSTLIIGLAATGKLLADPAVNRRQTPRRTGRGVRLRRLTLIDFALSAVSGGDVACRAQPTRPALPV